MFITTSNSPYEYYLKALKSSIQSMVKDDKLCKEIFTKTVAEFEANNRDLPSANIAPNHPERLLRLTCFVLEYAFKDSILTSITDVNGNPTLNAGFGVEYYTYDFKNEFTTSKKPYYINDHGYFARSTAKIYNYIQTQGTARRLLTTSNYGEYNVVDIEKLVRKTKNSFQDYYSTHSEMRTSLTPNKELQQVFGSILGDLSACIMNSRTSTTNKTF